jgi:hypothetical protein
MQIRRKEKRVEARGNDRKQKRSTTNKHESRWKRKKGKDKVVCLAMAHASCELAEEGALL